MSNTVLQYDPKAFALVLGNSTNGKSIIVSGFADDSFIDVERDEDAFSKKTGVDGITTRARNANYTGKVTFRLMQSSASNDDLSAFAIADQQTPPDGTFSITCNDQSGRSVFSSQTAWVKKMPKASYKKDVDVREWVVDCGQLQMFIGGN